MGHDHVGRVLHRSRHSSGSSSNSGSGSSRPPAVIIITRRVPSRAESKGNIKRRKSKRQGAFMHAMIRGLVRCVERSQQGNNGDKVAGQKYKGIVYGRGIPFLCPFLATHATVGEHTVFLSEAPFYSRTSKPS